MRAVVTLLLVTVTALVAGFIGFQAGVASNIGTAGGTVVWHAGFPFFGFLFPFLFFLLFIGLIAFAIGGRRRWVGPGWGPGYGGYGPTGGDDPRRQWIADAHRRLHEEEARDAGTPAGGSSETRPPSG